MNCCLRIWRKAMHSGFQKLYIRIDHCAKSVHIQSFFGPNFPVFGLNTEIYRVNFRIQSGCGKTQIRKTPDTDTFCAVISIRIILTKWMFVRIEVLQSMTSENFRRKFWICKFSKTASKMLKLAKANIELSPETFKILMIILK